MKELLIILIGSALVNNVVLSQFLGLCPFFWSFQEHQYGSGNGRCDYFCYHLILVCDQLDL